MPPPEKVEFWTQNKDVLASIVENENARRTRRSLPMLTEDEIDEGLDEVMALSAKGKTFSDYKFPVTKIPFHHQNGEVRFLHPPKPEAEKSSGMKFEIAKCENGFVMSHSGIQHIFRTPKELMGIFGKVLFGK